jgi:hypothetical protein
MTCGARRPDGSPCYAPTLIFDPRRGTMLCREHARAPLERRFGPRPDLDEKAEYVLRFLSLSSTDRHTILEELSPADRRDFIDLARLYDPD